MELNLTQLQATLLLEIVSDARARKNRLWERSYDKFTADQRAHLRTEIRELDTMFYALRGMDFEANLP